METKIKWFKEVLELEPSSKVFFPLARLYYDDGKLDEAVSVLRHGLERDPDHMEAKFLLVEILMGTDQRDVVREELESIVSLLSRYPGFWRAWAENFAPNSTDSALALNFLALYFQGSLVSWSQVIEKGLFALSSGDGREAGATAAALSDEAGPRTRTMAELMAKQGDFKGALSIYEELAASCPESEKAELAALIKETRARLEAGGAPEGGPAKEAGFSLPGKEKLLSALESLAKRLEARVAL
ncbi:MAG: hypothetical protein SVS15_08220 [Thermodesulfobacteriota bacterium]|nr:hypothetical protein [Thermodesulfobacteriota bacterium]